MKHFKFAVIVIAVGLVQSHTHAADFDKAAAVGEAKEITQAFAGTLKQALQSAMKSGGPQNALEVCNIEAMPITAKMAADSGAMVSRISLKNRNPENIPNDWQRAILEEFDQRVANNEDPTKIASATVEKLEDGTNQLRFMKALPTGGVCLACHGQGIDKNLQTKINALYPEDKATGYSAGEIRGAIVVVKDYK